MRAISPFVICLCLFMYIFILMGMQFFAGKLKFDENDAYDPNGKSPRYNFNTFFDASLLVFIILTGENWNEIMYDSMRSTSIIACVYFIIVMIFGNIIMLQLLVAIVLSNFDESHKNSEKRRIILAIEEKIELGSTVEDAIQLTLGHLWTLNFDDNEADAVHVKLGKTQIKIVNKTEPASSPNDSQKKVSILKKRTEVYQANGSSGKLQVIKTSIVKSNTGKNLNPNDLLNIMSPRSTHKEYLGEETWKPLNKEGESDEIPPEMADDMSIHLNLDMISDKLDVISPSKHTEFITKATTKNLREVIYEEPGESDDEEEKAYKTDREKKFYRRVTPVAFDEIEQYKVDSQHDIEEFRSYDEFEEQPKVNKIWQYISHASLFLMPDTTKFRQNLLTIVTTPEDIIVEHKASKNPEVYGITDLNKSQHMSQLKINDGKIIILDSKSKRKAKIFEYFIVTVILLS